MAILPASTTTAAQAVQALQSALLSLYDVREAAVLVRHIVEEATGWAPHELAIRRHERFPPGAKPKLNRMAARLLQGEPLQYVLGWAPFLDLRLTVGPGVLIPRPETEELVMWIAQELVGAPSGPGLDVGTGSGAIALAVARRLPQLRMHAVDLSADALRIAQANADALSIAVQFHQQDTLAAGAQAWQGLQLLVSNPPYVPVHEAASLHTNVREHEPHMALFVPDADPLLFYRHLLNRGRDWLAPGGYLFFELHPPTATAVEALTRQLNYVDVVLKEDLQGRPRMLKARRP